ncbi:rhamnan synthesis F family protein [Salipiger sp.]|uniref:rhamnan synthesis F family protein n=1 Tax=Salipiger sp. TaxID=2078585 RepID=UPI003A9846FA
MTADDIWKARTAGSDIAGMRGDFRFDAEVYTRLNREAPRPPDEAEQHWCATGRDRRRPANEYGRLRAAIPDLDRRIAGLVTDPQIRALIAAGEPDACELLFELILLGHPHDAAVSDFSATYYLTCHPALRDAGVQPFLHYIQHGIRENRRTLRALRQGYQEGGREFRPSRETCLLAVHDLSLTGAPLLGLELAREAAKQHNLVVTALADGPLREAYAEHAVEVLVTDDPLRDFPFYESEALPEIRFAVLNSVEALPVSQVLLRSGIPWATRVNEYPDYMLPAHKPLFTALFSDLLVFPATPLLDAWSGVFAETGFDAARDVLMLPQRSYVFGGVTAEAQEAARARLSRLIGTEVGSRRVVLGSGVAHWRKGADLFALTAQAARARGDDTLFVWVGDGRNPEDFHSGVWLERHLVEAGADRAGANLFFLPTGPYYDDLRTAADAFYLPARLDPLPNVVFEAAETGCHTVLFRGATGFDDPRYDGAEGLSFVPYGDIAGACDALLSVPPKRPTAQPARASFPRLFDAIAAALDARLADQRDFVVGGGAFDVPVMASTRSGDHAARIAEREKIWTYGRKFIWQSADQARAALAAGGNAVHARCEIRTHVPTDAGMPEINLHMHAHYTRDLGGDLLYYRALREARRLVVTTDTEAKKDEILHIASEAGVAVDCRVMPNVGRDVLPFLRLFAEGIAAEDETWCHVHQKRSPGVSQDGLVWKRFQMVGLLGDDTRLSPALGLAMQPEVGLVAPFDPFRVGWSGARRLLHRVAPALGVELPREPLVFPVGNMFHVRGSVALRMLGLFGMDHPWPNEPLPHDGTVFHLIERLWPAVAADCGLRSVFLDKPDQPRS